MEPRQVPPPPHQYVGLGIQPPGLDRHGYTEVIADPEYDDNPQVCMEIHLLCDINYVM